MTIKHPSQQEILYDDLDDDGVYTGDVVIHNVYDDEPSDTCPKCDSENICCTGSDSVVNIGAPGDGLEHVSWWLCEDCGHRWVGD